MTTLTRTFCAIGGLLALTVPVNAFAAGPGEAAAAQGDARAGAPPQGAPRGVRPPMGPEITENFSRTVRLGSRNGFELSTGFGQVTINGVGGDDVRIEAIKRVRHADRDAGRALLQSVTVRIAERGGVVEAITEYSGRRDPVFVDYTVSLPTRASVTLKTFGGTIRVNNVKGELRVEAYSGDIVFASVGGIRHAKTLVGNVTITDADGEEVNAETLNGALQLRNVRARSMELATIGGSLTVNDARCDRCAIKTVSGDIEFAAPLTRGSRYDIQSQSGDIRLLPGGNPSFDLEARTFGGQLRSDFPLKPAAATTPRPDTLRGSYGEESGAVLSLTTFSGDISVVRK